MTVPRERTPTSASPPPVDLGADSRVHKRIAKGLAPGVETAWEKLKAQLRKNPRFVGPDKREVWKKAFPDIPNHRHADLPGTWRACWTIRNADGGARELVTVLFLGTHKEYDSLYGFSTS